MRLAALISGGKDSIYAAYLAKKEHELVCAVSLLSDNPDSYMWHVPNADLTKLQAELMSVPIIQQRTAGEKEKELEDLKTVLASLGSKIDGVVTGAIASKYQMSRIEKIATDLGIACVAPLWKKEPLELLQGMLRAGFEIIITAVAAGGLEESWLGRKLDSAAVSELISLSKKHRFSVIGEGGEFETFVLDCPLFSKRIKIVEAKKNWDAKSRSGTFEIKRTELVKK
jgi:ABC transporter with metal-binding/Fe-S-binding domain ATP-binding protein